MILTLKPITEARLLALAAQRGQTLEALLDSVIEREAEAEQPALVKKPSSAETSPPAAPPLSPTAALFAQWAEEDKTDDPEELARRQQEGDELLENLRKYPVSFRRVDVSGPGWEE